MTTSSSPAVSAGTTTDTGAAPFSAVQFITTTHLILIAVLAVIVVIGMIYGARLKRLRRIAEAEEQQRLDDYETEHPDADAADGPSVSSNDLSSPETAPLPPAPAQPIAAAAIQEERSPPPAPPVAIAADSPAGGPVTQLKGLGPKVATRLAELGITTVGQIAALDDDAADALDVKLGAFQGRIARDRWVEQARFLAAGDRAGFEAVFGRL